MEFDMSCKQKVNFCGYVQSKEICDVSSYVVVIEDPQLDCVIN